MCLIYAAMMSWGGCLLTESEIFVLSAENRQILLKISVIPILLTFIYLVALNLLVNNQLNSWSNSSLWPVLDRRPKVYGRSRRFRTYGYGYGGRSLRPFLRPKVLFVVFLGLFPKWRLISSFLVFFNTQVPLVMEKSLNWAQSDEKQFKNLELNSPI